MEASAHEDWHLDLSEGKVHASDPVLGTGLTRRKSQSRSCYRRERGAGGNGSACVRGRQSCANVPVGLSFPLGQ